MADTDTADGLLTVEVILALPDRQVLKVLSVQPGTTVAEAVQQADLQAQFPEIDIANAPLGIWSKQVPPEQLLKAGDRIEIYRPLPMDPREARRILAAVGKGMGKAAGAD